MEKIVHFRIKYMYFDLSVIGLVNFSKFFLERAMTQFVVSHLSDIKGLGRGTAAAAKIAKQ